MLSSSWPTSQIAHLMNTSSSSENLRIERTPEGQLRVHREGQIIPVMIRPCFPWSASRQFLSLRDRDQAEVLLIEDLEQLSQPEQEAILQALLESEFTLEIRKIHSVTRHFEMRIWKVDTTHGPRTFEIRIDDWPRQLPHGGLAISDLAGDLYTITDQSALDERSRKLLFAYAD